MKRSFYIKKTRISVTAIVLLAAIIMSCRSSYNAATARWNLGAIYNPTRSTLHPVYKVYHNNTNTSVLFFKIFTDELQFQPLGEGGSLISNVDLEFTLFETSPETKQVTDSSTYNFKIYQKSSGKSYISQIPIKAEEGKSYSLKIILRDNLRNTFNLTFLEIEKNPDFGQQYFNLTNYEGTPMFRNIIIGNGSFKVHHNRPSSDSLYVSYYKNDVPLPKPTFASFPETSVYKQRDSLFVVKYSPNNLVTLSYNGLYFIQFDTNSTEGISVTKFDKGFPKVTKPEELLAPIAYLTTTGEFSNLLKEKHKKLASDNFWKEAGGSTHRGRELIRIYYNRVYFSNYYFTNTIPGWKTDRGMVYIVYGPPHDIKKTANSETWIYFKKNTKDPISIKFNYKPGRFHLNQYQLERSENHSWHWQEAVYSWTNGKIFLLD